MVNITGIQTALIAAFTFGVLGNNAMAAEPVWDQAAYEAMGEEAQKQFVRDYKAAVEATLPPQTLTVQSRPVAPVQTSRRMRARSSSSNLLQYDDGIVTSAPGTSSLMYGNRFDTADGSGPIADSATVSNIQFFIASGAGTDNVFVSAFDNLNETAGTANPVGSASMPLNNGSGDWNTASAGALGITNAFAPAGEDDLLVGVWYIAGDTVGLGTGTAGGQGHHGIQINDIVGTGYAELPGLNALVRLQGSNLPIEMIDLTIE
jgi:hypothetical protein